MWLKYSYFLVLLADLVAIIYFPEYRFFSKPLIMPLLAIYGHLYHHIPKVILVALSFAFLGDVFLMFSDKSLFLIGMFAFLIMQAIYAVHAFSYRNNKINWIPTGFMLGLALSFHLKFFQSLGDFKIPVLVYTVFIMLMATTALNSSKPKLFKIGACIFVLSDLILAINLFVDKRLVFSLAVILTYGLAQFLIIFSFKKKQVLSS